MKIGFLGVGNMANAIIRGISASVGYESILLFDKDVEKCKELISLGATAASDINGLFKACDYVFIAVKPQQFYDAVSNIEAEGLSCTVISIMAGIKIESVKAVFGNNVSVIRAMPNAPMMNGYGAVAVCRDAGVEDSKMNFIKELLSSIAVVKEVSEDKMSVITALSGSGPAYYYLFTKYIAEYAVSAGLDTDTAELFAAQTALGAGVVMNTRPHELDDLIRIVKSPNGTTEKALLSFDDNNLKMIVFDALIACEKRADELSNGK